MNEDRELLARYIREGSQDAFSELVRRHLTLVYSAALRQVLNAQLAEEVCQIVFTNLARKARSLGNDVILAGWLHRATRFTALDLLRKEHRRFQREHMAAIMTEIDAAPAPEWDRVRPLLDEALDQLPPNDRDALLLRFFGQRSLAEVGSALGIAEDAARKRIRRALEKLRRALGKRGVKTTSEALLLLLAAEAALICPAALAGTLAASALAPVPLGSSFLYYFMAASKTKVALTLATSMVLIGTIALQTQNSKARRMEGSPDEAGLEANPMPRNSKVSAALRAGQGDAPISESVDPELAALLAKVTAALHEPGRTRSYPQSTMREAMAALGARRKEAVPLLRAALATGSYELRNRAASGLQLIGREARAAVPELMSILRQSAQGVELMLATSALEAIAPEAALVPELIEIMRENEEGRLMVSNLISTIFDFEPESTAQYASLLAPLLRDENPEVRMRAAYTLALMKKEQAAAEVLPVAREALQSTHDDTLLGGITTLANIGNAALDAAPELLAAAERTKREDIRMAAYRLLDELDPNLRKNDSTVASMLAKQEQLRAFQERVKNGEASVPELIAALSKVPKGIPTAAKALGEIGFAGFGTNRDGLIAAVHGLKGALMEKYPQARLAASEALKRLQPMSPKPIYDSRELEPAFQAVQQRLNAASEDQRVRVKAALDLFRVTQGTPGAAAPTQTALGSLQLFAATLEEADAQAFKAFAAEMTRIDAQFLGQR